MCKLKAGALSSSLSWRFSLMNPLGSFRLFPHIYTCAKRNCHELSLEDHLKSLNCHRTKGELGFGCLLNTLLEASVTTVRDLSPVASNSAPSVPFFSESMYYLQWFFRGSFIKFSWLKIDFHQMATLYAYLFGNMVYTLCFSFANQQHLINVPCTHNIGPIWWIKFLSWTLVSNDCY